MTDSRGPLMLNARRPQRARHDLQLRLACTTGCRAVDGRPNLAFGARLTHAIGDEKASRGDLRLAELLDDQEAQTPGRTNINSPRGELLEGILEAHSSERPASQAGDRTVGM